MTGIPTQMKMDFEQRGGLSFDDVRVHYNSDKPAQLQALAYTQGTQVYVGPGQERHLPHELGHVFQQKSQTIPPTHYIHGIAVNADPAMERRADILAHRMQPAAAEAAAPQHTGRSSSPTAPPVQMFMVGKITNGAGGGNRLAITYSRIHPQEDAQPAQDGAPAEPVPAAGDGAQAGPIPAAGKDAPDGTAAAPETGAPAPADASLQESAPPAAAEDAASSYIMSQEANQRYGSESASDEHKFSVLEKIAKFAEEILSTSPTHDTGGPHIALSKVHTALLISINSYFALKKPGEQIDHSRADAQHDPLDASNTASRTIRLTETNLEKAVKQAIHTLAQKSGMDDSQLDPRISGAGLAGFGSQNYSLNALEKVWLAHIAKKDAITDYRVIALNPNNPSVGEIYGAQNASVHGEMIVMEHLLENPDLIPPEDRALAPDEYRVIRVGGTKLDCATCNTHFFGGGLMWNDQSQSVTAFPLDLASEGEAALRAESEKWFTQLRALEQSGQLAEVIKLRNLKEQATSDPEKAEAWKKTLDDFTESGQMGKLKHLSTLKKLDDYRRCKQFLAAMRISAFGRSYSDALASQSRRLVRSRGSSGIAFDHVTNFDDQRMYINLSK